jgi:DNA end-binding protein Ku
MYYADEIRPTKGIVPSRRPTVDEKELEMAETLIERFTSRFDHDQYEDEYRKRLLKIVKRKHKGEEIHAEAPPPEREEPADILDALRASVEAAKAGRSSNGRGKKKTARRARRGAKAKAKAKA